MKKILIVLLLGMTILLVSTKWLLPNPHPHLPETNKQTETFLEIPEVMNRIAFCESSNNHKAESDISSAKGTYQIIRKTEELCEKWLDVELDMLNRNDNELCAMWLYDRNGTKDWNASINCWSN